MKKTLLLSAAAAVSLFPLPVAAQNQAPAKELPAPVDPGAPAAIAQTKPADKAQPRLPRVQFTETTLGEVVSYLQQMSGNEEEHPAAPLNVVLSPGLEAQVVPSLSLRNVTPTEVLTVVTQVLELNLEPVTGDDGTLITLLVKSPEGGFGTPAKAVPAANPAGGAGMDSGSPFGGGSAGSITGLAAGGMPAGGGEGSGISADAHSNFGNGGGGFSGVAGVGGGEGAPVLPQAYQLAASPRMPGFGGAAPAAGVRIFGIGSLIASSSHDQKTREEERQKKLMRLIDALSRIANDEGGGATIKAYEEVDLLIVRSADPSRMALVAEAIEAMKQNAAKTSHEAEQLRTTGLNAELQVLKGQLALAQEERDMIRRTAEDQARRQKAMEDAGLKAK